MDFFDRWLHASICDDWSKYSFFSTQESCLGFANGVSKQGFYSLMMQFYFNCREVLSESKSLTSTEIFNSYEWAVITVIQRDIVTYKVPEYMDYLLSFIKDVQSTTINIKLIVMLCYVFAAVLFFLAFWIPYIMRLRTEIWRTDSMLILIPTEVITKDRFLKEAFEKRMTILLQN